MMLLGPKNYNMNGIWDLKPYYLGRALGFLMLVRNGQLSSKNTTQRNLEPALKLW